MDTLYLDILLSELVLDGVLKTKCVLDFMEKKWISAAREICNIDVWWDRVSGCENETMLDKKFLKVLQDALRDNNRREKVLRLTETGHRLGMFSLSMGDVAYPSRLKHLSGMPINLYGIGDPELLSIPASIAVVGTRAPTPYGIRAVTDIVRDLCKNPICIVSGLARGIDTRAHQTALRENGKTIAVLANGLDKIYPRENAALFEEIRQCGCVLSELPPGRNPIRQYFPARNRILSALSDAIVIAEAGERSGTLHTAAFAAAQGREVFVLPGNIYSEKSKGGLKLIQDGAQILLSAEDILFHMADISFFREIDRLRDLDTLDSENEKKVKKGKGEQKIAEDKYKKWIIEILEAENKSAEALIEILGISFPELALLLAEMELSGIITEFDGKYMASAKYYSLTD